MKRYGALLLVIALLAVLFCGCAAEEKTFAEDFAFTEAPNYGYSDTLSKESLNRSDANTVAENRKLIKTVTLRVETENFDSTISELEAHIDVCGGYIETVNIYNRYSSDRRNASYVIRVPADCIEAFTGEIGNLCNILTRSERQEDITLQYVDTQSECTALRVEQERLLELLKTAENLTDILEIENRLTEIRYRLESVESQLRTYDDLVSFATVNLDIEEVEIYTPTEKKGFWEKIGDGFVDSIKGVWSLICGLFYLFVVALPYLLFIAAFMGIFIFIIVLIIRRKNKKTKN